MRSVQKGGVIYDKSALAPFTVATLGGLGLAVCPASILTCPTCVKAAITGDTTVSPSLWVSARALGVLWLWRGWRSRHGRLSATLFVSVRTVSPVGNVAVAGVRRRTIVIAICSPKIAN